MVNYEKGVSKINPAATTLAENLAVKKMILENLHILSLEISTKDSPNEATQNFPENMSNKATFSEVGKLFVLKRPCLI